MMLSAPSSTQFCFYTIAVETKDAFSRHSTTRFVNYINKHISAIDKWKSSVFETVIYTARAKNVAA